MKKELIIGIIFVLLLISLGIYLFYKPAPMNNAPDLVITDVKFIDNLNPNFKYLGLTIKNEGDALTNPARIMACYSLLGGNRCIVGKISGDGTYFDIPTLAPQESVFNSEVLLQNSELNNIDSVMIDSEDNIQEKNEKNNYFDMLKGPFCVSQSFPLEEYYQDCKNSGYKYDTCVGYLMTKADPSINNIDTKNSNFSISWQWNNPRSAIYCSKGCKNNLCV